MEKQKVIDLHLEVNQIIVENELHYLEAGGPGILVAACQHGTHALTLTIWSIDSSEQITYKRQLDFTGEGKGVFVDFNYISVLMWAEETHLEGKTFYFISTSTLNIERSFSACSCLPSYFLNGILALSNQDNCIW